MMACIGWTWEREVRLRFHPLQMGEMAHGRLAFSWPACAPDAPPYPSLLKYPPYINWLDGSVRGYREQRPLALARRAVHEGGFVKLG